MRIGAGGPLVIQPGTSGFDLDETVFGLRQDLFDRLIYAVLEYAPLGQMLENLPCLVRPV